MTASDSSDRVARWLTIEDLRHQFELAWRTGRPQRVEECLAAVPASDRALLLMELLGVELQLRASLHDVPQLNEYVARFPQFAEQVARVFHEALPREPPTDVAPLRPGGVWGNFRVIREIGRGGMGVVYEAEELALGRAVALKVLLIPGDNYVARARFLREARAAAGLHHSNIVPVLAVGEHAGSVFYAMQLIRGQTLHSLSGVTDWTTAAHIGCQVARALQYAHERGIVHRDVKPANVLVDATGNAWLVDFGLAKLDDSDLTRRDEILGTLRYLAPESLDGQHDGRSDLYALGLTLYELLARERPFAAAEGGQLLEHLRTARLTPLGLVAPQVPRDLATIISKATQRDSRDRYQTAGEMADDLERFLRDEPIRARRHTRTELAVRLVRRNPLLSALSGAVLLLLVIGALGSLMAAMHFRRMRDHQQQLAQERESQRQVAEASAVQARTAEQQVLRTLAQLHRNAGLWYLAQGDTLRALLSTVQALTHGVTAPPADTEPGTLSFDASLRHRIGMLLAHVPPIVARHVFAQYEWKRMVFDPFTGTQDTNAPKLQYLPDGTVSIVSKGNDVAFHWDPDAGTVQPVLGGAEDSANAASTQPPTRVATQVCFAADGRHVVTYDRAGHLALWRCDTNSLVCRLEQTPAGRPSILGCWLSPDEQRVVVGFATNPLDGMAILWDVASGRRISAEPWRVSSTPSRYWLRVEFSDDSRRVLVAGRDAMVADTATGDLIPSGTEPLSGLAILSRNGNYLIVPGPASVRIQEVTTPASSSQPAPLVLPPTATVAAVASDPRDRWAVLGTTAGDLYVIDVAARAVAQRPTLHSEQPVRELAIHPSGEAVAVCDWAGRVRVYHLPSAVPLTPPVQLPEPVSSLAWRRDGQRLAAVTQTGDATIWDMSLVTSRHLFDPTSRGCALSPDGGRLVSWGADGQTRVWDVTQRPSPPLATLAGVSTVVAQWHPDGVRVVLGTKPQADGAGFDLHLWQADASEPVRLLRQQTPDVYRSFSGLEFLAHGRKLVFGGTCGPIIVDIDTGDEILRGDLRTPPVFTPVCCAISDQFVAACRRFTAADEVNALRVWASTGSVCFDTQLPARLRVRGLAWSPDGSQLAAHGEFGVRVWQAPDWQPVPMSEEITQASLELMAFDPTGRHLALVDDNAVCRVVSLANPSWRSPEFSFPSKPLQVVFDRSGTRLAVVTYTQGVTLWDWSRGEPLSPPWRSEAQLTQATFAADDIALIVQHRAGGLEWIALPPVAMDSTADLLRVAQHVTGLAFAEGAEPHFLTAEQWCQLAPSNASPEH